MKNGVRIPARMAEYMLGTGWGQQSEPTTHPTQVRLLDLLLHAPTRADGSFTIPDVDESMAARLIFEAEHCGDGLRYGDNTPDTLADYNAARAVERGVAKVLGREMYYNEARDILMREGD